MDKNLKIIIIGFGSIGQRHYKNLLSLGYKNINVYDPLNETFSGFPRVVGLKLLNKKTLKDFKIAFICSPNNFHIKQALLCARAGLDLFIEKPLSHNLNGVEKLIRLCRKKKLVSLVGCNMRFHPCLQFIKKYIADGKLGKIYGIHHESGYFLPYWRSGQDYRKNYAAKHSSGGGIILDDSHEFDLLFWLNDFRPVVKSNLLSNNSEALEIETEDNCLASFLFANKVLGSIRCDYLQKHYSRCCKIVGEKGNLEWDFKENIVWLKDEKGQKILKKVTNYDLNKMYLEEIKYFIKQIKKRKSTYNDVAIAAMVLKYCLNNPR